MRQAQETWKSAEYGIRVAQVRQHTKVTWDVDRDTFVALMSLHALRDGILAQMESEIVAQARLEGTAWQEIGWALGITRQAAQKRHPNADADARLLAAL